MTDTRRAADIAAKARLYRLLAGRPEYNIRDRGDRIDRTSGDVAPIPVPMLDAALIETATELDMLCGYAVRQIIGGGSGRRLLLDVLGTLEADTLCAMYRALPPSIQRGVIKTSGTWSYAVHHEPEGVDEWAEDFADLNRCVGHPELNARDRELRRFMAGLPHDLSPEEVERFADVQRGTRDLTRRIREAGPDADPKAIVSEWLEAEHPGREQRAA